MLIHSKAILSLAAAVALAMAWSTLPATAYDVEPGSIPPAPAALMRAQQVKSKPGKIRNVRAQPARVVSLARPDCFWSASFCGRPFVLMIGIGF